MSLTSVPRHTYRTLFPIMRLQQNKMCPRLFAEFRWAYPFFVQGHEVMIIGKTTSHHLNESLEATRERLAEGYGLCEHNRTFPRLTHSFFILCLTASSHPLAVRKMPWNLP